MVREHLAAQRANGPATFTRFFFKHVGEHLETSCSASTSVASGSAPASMTSAGPSHDGLGGALSRTKRSSSWSSPGSTRKRSRG
eukprot:2779063-Amphidinium_carterae.1